MRQSVRLIHQTVGQRPEALRTLIRRLYFELDKPMSNALNPTGESMT